MQNNLITSLLLNATRALSNLDAKELQALSLYECAFLLDMLPAELLTQKKYLTHRLIQTLNIKWITEGDAGEVFAVLAALWQHSPTHIGGKQLSAAVQRLIKSEVTVGGPYYNNGQITIVANLHIALFLERAAQPLPNVTALLTKATAVRQLQHTPVNLAYVVHQLAKVAPSPTLHSYIRQHWRTSLQSAADMAASLAALDNSVPQTKRTQALAIIRAAQRSDGFWDGPCLLVKGDKKGHEHIIATALIADALRTLQLLPSSPLEVRQQHMIAAAKRKFSGFGEPLRSSALAMIDTIHEADKNFEVTLLPYFFAMSLKRPTSLTERQHQALSLANIYTWVAYTIYDDFLDNEGNPAYLSVANVAMRLSLQHFKNIHFTRGYFDHYVAKIFAAMDEANAWEIDNCRFRVQPRKIIITKLPCYGNRLVLARRAFAHTLGPMAILFARSTRPHQLQHIEVAFQHYLIARQLNDDMHDWQKDMRAGQVSFVVAAILTDMRVKPGAHDTRNLLAHMRRSFTDTTMPKVCRRILQHLHIARQEFTRCQLLRKKNTIYQLLDDIELSVRYSLDIHAKSQTFVKESTKFL